MILNIIVFIIVILIIAGIPDDSLPSDKCRKGNNKNLCGTCHHTFCQYRYFDE